VVILTAYFDESGTHSGSEAVAVAGYVSTPDRWERFGQEWREALAAYNIEYFCRVGRSITLWLGPSI
jgi:hypothetical protein